MPSSAFWIALLLLLAIVATALVGTLMAGAYLLYQLARERRLEADAQYRAPVPPARPGAAEDGEEEPTDEEKAAMIRFAIDAARDEGRLAKDEWREEKRAEGMSDEEIEEFLANRPLLELN